MKPFRFLSLCSGIEAASVAWAPLGWRAASFAEIDPFASAVLAHRFPEIPNRGDMTLYREWPDDAVDLVCGGTPCQSFSVAGLRAGLADPRGNLALVFLGVVDRYRPRWVVWENVPGVRSSSGGRDLGAFLGALGALGYGWAYRSLDAQYVRVDGFPLAVPQRRERVFVVGCLGDERRAAQVLFDAAGLRGDPAPRREAGPVAAALTGGGVGVGGGDDNQARAGHLIAALPNGVVSHSLLAKGGSGRLDYESETFVAHTLRADGFDASEDGTGRGTPLVAQTLTASWERSKGATGGNNPGLVNPVVSRAGVRRLMPVECERLMGFPDGWTDVPYRGRRAADGPRYRALGNSWAVNVARWVGRRIEMVDGRAP